MRHSFNVSNAISRKKLPYEDGPLVLDLYYGFKSTPSIYRLRKRTTELYWSPASDLSPPDQSGMRFISPANLDSDTYRSVRFVLPKGDEED
jgi:hypothetical protein